MSDLRCDKGGAPAGARTPKLLIRRQMYWVNRDILQQTNKDNNISRMTALNYCHISPNMACFCKLLAQNWHKNSALVRACSGFFHAHSYR